MPQTRPWRAGLPAIPATRFPPPPARPPASAQAAPFRIVQRAVAKPAPPAPPRHIPPVHQPAHPPGNRRPPPAHPAPAVHTPAVPGNPSNRVVQRSQLPPEGRPRNVSDVTDQFKKHTVLSPVRQGITETFTKRRDFMTALVKGEFAYALPWPLVRYPLYFLLVPKEQRKQDYRKAAETYVRVEGKKAVNKLLSPSFWFFNPIMAWKALKGTAEIVGDVAYASVTATEKEIEQLWGAHDAMISAHVKKMVATIVTGWSVSKAIAYTIPRTPELYRRVPRSAQRLWLVTGIGAFLMQLHELQTKFERLPGPFMSDLSESVDKRLKEQKEAYLKRLDERLSEGPFVD